MKRSSLAIVLGFGITCAAEAAAEPVALVPEPPERPAAALESASDKRPPAAVSEIAAVPLRGASNGYVALAEFVMPTGRAPVEASVRFPVSYVPNSRVPIIRVNNEVLSLEKAPQSGEYVSIPPAMLRTGANQVVIELANEGECPARIMTEGFMVLRLAPWMDDPKLSDFVDPLASASPRILDVAFVLPRDERDRADVLEAGAMVAAGIALRHPENGVKAMVVDSVDAPAAKQAWRVIVLDPAGASGARISAKSGHRPTLVLSGATASEVELAARKFTDPGWDLPGESEYAVTGVQNHTLQEPLYGRVDIESLKSSGTSSFEFDLPRNALITKYGAVDFDLAMRPQADDGEYQATILLNNHQVAMLPVDDQIVTKRLRVPASYLRSGTNTLSFTLTEGGRDLCGFNFTRSDRSLLAPGSRIKVPQLAEGTLTPSLDAIVDGHYAWSDNMPTIALPDPGDEAIAGAFTMLASAARQAGRPLRPFDIRPHSVDGDIVLGSIDTVWPAIGGNMPSHLRGMGPAGRPLDAETEPTMDWFEKTVSLGIGLSTKARDMAGFTNTGPVYAEVVQDWGGRWGIAAAYDDPASPTGMRTVFAAPDLHELAEALAAPARWDLLGGQVTLFGPNPVDDFSVDYGRPTRLVGVPDDMEMRVRALRAVFSLRPETWIAVMVLLVAVGAVGAAMGIRARDGGKK